MAAGAGALGVSLGGAAIYHGELHQRPLLGSGPQPQGRDIYRALALVRQGVLLGCWCWPDSGPWGGCMLEHGGRCARRRAATTFRWRTGWTCPPASRPGRFRCRRSPSRPGPACRRATTAWKPPPASTTAPNGYCRWLAARRRSRPCRGCGGRAGRRPVAVLCRARPRLAPGRAPGAGDRRGRGRALSRQPRRAAGGQPEQPHRAGLRARRAAGLACPPATSRRLAAGRRGVHGLYPEVEPGGL